MIDQELQLDDLSLQKQKGHQANDLISFIIRAVIAAVTAVSIPVKSQLLCQLSYRPQKIDRWSDGVFE